MKYPGLSLARALKKSLGLFTPKNKSSTCTNIETALFRNISNGFLLVLICRSTEQYGNQIQLF
jgi:hypothetical protein